MPKTVQLERSLYAGVSVEPAHTKNTGHSMMQQWTFFLVRLRHIVKRRRVLWIALEKVACDQVLDALFDHSGLRGEIPRHLLDYSILQLAIRKRASALHHANDRGI